MFKYVYPTFDFSASLSLATRMDTNETQNQAYRTSFMRDRDRVMYSSAFRRLSGKTQIYLAGKNDNQRNRLTHTLEVSQIARTVSQALGLNCDLTEAIALAHDLGHTPFGHAGEQILHEIMVPNSQINIKDSPMKDLALSASKEVQMPLFGFKHNIQSLRIAAALEASYGKSGLNLTNYTLWGILHHSSTSYKDGRVNTSYLEANYKDQYQECIQLPGENSNEAWSFEAFVVEKADEIAQWHHDLEDALRGNAMTCTEVCGAIQKILNPIMNSEDTKRLNDLKGQTLVTKKYVTDLSRIVVNTLVNYLIECSLYNLSFLWNKYVKDTSKKESFFKTNKWNDSNIQTTISFNKMQEEDSPIKNIQEEYSSIISEKIHHSRDVERMNAKGQYIIKKLFQAYFSHPQQLPDNIIKQYMIDIDKYEDLSQVNKLGVGAVRIDFENLICNKDSINTKIALMRKICDHIAGMTDHYAIEEYEHLYG